MKILLVEDDVFFAQQLKELLEDHCATVLSVRSLEEAVVQDFDSVDVIIADLMLPNNPAASEISDVETRSGFWSGIALYRWVTKKGLKLPFFLLSSAGSFGEAATWAAEKAIPFISKEDGRSAVLNALVGSGVLTSERKPQAFIVHGHDEKALSELKDYLQNTLKWEEPIVLRDQPSNGRTIIEKFEESSVAVDWVFVLMTPDDGPISLDTNDDRRRARQNVVFELGFFYGRLGRRDGKIIVLQKGVVELPSDIQGIVWIDISNGVKAAGESIRKEVDCS